MKSITAIIKELSPYYFYGDNNSIVLKIVRKYSFTKYIFTIYNFNDAQLLVFEVRNKLFSTRINIISQNLDKSIKIINENSITVDEILISVADKSTIFGKNKFSISIDNEIVGEILEQKCFPHKKYILHFDENNNFNLYCSILFAIKSTFYADGI